jgi:hypothetical protein
VAEIDVTPRGPREFEVQVHEDEGATSHRVTVPEELMEELGVSDDELEEVVRASFEFLLEREPASAIMAEFSLDVIERYFPEYRRELPGRL